MKTSMIIAFGLVLAQSAFAAPIVTSWTNPECATGSCEVKGLKLFIDKVAAKTFSANSVSAEIETTEAKHLTKYGIVQYIKGCHYSKTPQGFVRYSIRNSLAKSVPFIHKDWEVDSGDDVDPLYWSNDAAGFDDLRGYFVPRNSGYAYANPALTDNWGSWAGKMKNLKANKIYITDMPTPSTWSISADLTQTAVISSLKFRTCVYEISKIPTAISDAKVVFDGAIGCLEWSSNYEYDFAKRKFVDMGKEISEVCR